MGIDMKKEIKLSDLWKRGPKEPKAEKPPKPQKEPKVKKPKAEKPPKEPKQSRFGRKAKEKVAALDARQGPPARDIPLMRAFNLLPREEAAEKKGRENALPHILVALGAVLVFAALAAFYLSASSSVTSKQGEIDALRSELAALQVPEKPGSKGAAADLESQRTARTAALSTALADRLAWDRILRELALVLPASVTLDELQATAPSPGSAAGDTDVRTLTLHGSAPDQAAVALLLSRVQVIRELGSVELKNAAAPPDAEGPITFEVVATVRKGAAA